MKMRTILLGAVVAVGIVIAAVAMLSHEARSAAATDATMPSVEHGSIPPESTRPSPKQRRAEEAKARLALATSMPRREPVEDKTGWEEIPRELDAMLSEEASDSGSALAYEKDAQRFIEKQHLEGTSVTDASCGKSLCRISFSHDSLQAFKEYQRRLVFSPWGGASNYFSGEIRDNEEVDSFLWLGRDGLQLPLDDLRALHASGKHAAR